MNAKGDALWLTYGSSPCPYAGPSPCPYAGWSEPLSLALLVLMPVAKTLLVTSDT